MIKIANNLQTLVKASNEGDSNIMRDLGLLGLGGAGIGGLTLAANKHRKHWIKNLDGSYTRRMSTLADRPSPQNPFGRPTNYTADGRPIYIDEAALRDAPPTPGQQRIRIDEAELRGPKPPTSVFTDPDLFSNILKRIIRRR